MSQPANRFISAIQKFGRDVATQKRFRRFGLIALVVLVFDQWTKWLAIKHLTHAFEDATSFGERLSAFLWRQHPARAEPVAVLESFWHHRYAENPGAAWSFLANMPQWFTTPFFLSISVVAMIFILVYFRNTTAKQRVLRFALPLVFGGAIGNFLDRARLGYVIDFIEWHWYDKASWPIFNVADSAISVGVALLVIDMLLHRGNEHKEASAGDKAKSAS